LHALAIFEATLLQRFYIQTITYQIFALMVRQAHHERKYLIFITVRAELVEAH
jgi:hypothetical protein